MHFNTVQHSIGRIINRIFENLRPPTLQFYSGLIKILRDKRLDIRICERDYLMVKCFSLEFDDFQLQRPPLLDFCLRGKPT